VQPSAIALTGRVGEPVEIGPRFPISGQPDMELVGSALHGFMAADRPSMKDSQRRDIASGLLTRWTIASAVNVVAVLGAAEALRDWADRNWPGARWHREWPIRMRLKTGSTLRGTADLVLETRTGSVVIDHKSYPGSREKAIERAASYAGQVLAYADAIRTATGKPVLGCFIHLPVLGLVVPVE
jgi:ATP-dependent helicase/nuclease subunit A